MVGLPWSHRFIGIVLGLLSGFGGNECCIICKTFNYWRTFNQCADKGIPVQNPFWRNNNGVVAVIVTVFVHTCCRTLAGNVVNAKPVFDLRNPLCFSCGFKAKIAAVSNRWQEHSLVRNSRGIGIFHVSTLWWFYSSGWITALYNTKYLQEAKIDIWKIDLVYSCVAHAS